MTPEQEADKDRKLRLLRSAAGSAIYNGATEDEARAAFEEGLAEMLAIVKADRERQQLTAAGN